MSSTRTAIITGLNGQLGQFMAKYLLENEPTIRVVGTLRHKSFDNQPYIFDRSKVTIELMDLSDAHSIESLIVKYKPAYFINTGANAFVGESWGVPAQHFEINALAVLHQLEAIRKYSPETRYFSMGTSEEFAVSEKTGPQDETTRLAPKSPYGASKCAARHIVSVWQQSYNLYAIQGWTFNFESEIRGPKYVTRKITLAVARIADAIKRGVPFEPLELGNLDSFRSWQYAEDVADGIWRMLNQEKYRNVFYTQPDGKVLVKPEPFVLSAQDTHTVREFVTKAFSIAGIDGALWLKGAKPEDEEYSLVDYPYGTDKSRVRALVRVNPAFYRPADVTYLHGNSTRARTELGWSPKVSFDELVTRMVRSDMAAYRAGQGRLAA